LKKSAFSLALTLWIVAMMGLVSVLYLSYGKKVVTKSTQLHKKLLLTFQAESMVELLKFYGSTGRFNGNYILNTLVQQYYPSFPKKIFIDSRETRWKNTKILLQDTAGLISIDDIDALSNCLEYELQDSKDKKVIIKDSLMDWLDSDSFSTLNGAEDSFYQKYGYESRDMGYFASSEELFLLRVLQDINRSKQDKFLTQLAISSKRGRNISTLNNSLLQCIFNISKGDLIELKKLKEEEGLYRFMSFFETVYKENYDLERDGGVASQILRIKITSFDNNITKEINTLIDFGGVNNKKFETLNYED